MDDKIWFIDINATGIDKGKLQALISKKWSRAKTKPSLIVCDKWTMPEDQLKQLQQSGIPIKTATYRNII